MLSIFLSSLQNSFIPPQHFFGDIIYAQFEVKSFIYIISAFVGAILSAIYILYSNFYIHRNIFVIPLLNGCNLVCSLLYTLIITHLQISRSKIWILPSILVTLVILCLNLYIYYQDNKFRIPGVYDVTFIQYEYLFLISEISLLVSLFGMLNMMCIKYKYPKEMLINSSIYICHMLSNKFNFRDADNLAITHGQTRSVYLHPTFQVVSTPEDIHLILQPSFPLQTKDIETSDMFLSTDAKDRGNPSTRGRDASSISPPSPPPYPPRYNNHKDVVTSMPPILLMLGSVISLIWVGYIAFYMFIMSDSKSNVLFSTSQSLSHDEAILAQQWRDVQHAVNALYLAMDSTNNTFIADAINNLNESMSSMDDVVLQVNHDLHHYSQFFDSLASSVCLSVKIGGIIALPIIAIQIILPLLSAVRIRRQMQAGLWRPGHTPGHTLPRDRCGMTRRSSRTGIPSFSICTMVGTQLGTAAISFICMSGIAILISIAIVWKESRYFMWSLKSYFVGLVVAFLVGQMSYILMTMWCTCSNSSTSKVYMLLVHYNMVSGQIYGFLRYLFFLVYCIATLPRIDIPLYPNSDKLSHTQFTCIKTSLSSFIEVDFGYNAFLDLIEWEVRYANIYYLIILLS